MPWGGSKKFTNDARIAIETSQHLLSSGQKLMVNFFQLSHEQVPSYSTVRRAMMLVKTSDLIDIFNQWARGLTNPI
jgi:hypothetical protein